jgi:hypothetical protein
MLNDVFQSAQIPTGVWVIFQAKVTDVSSWKDERTGKPVHMVSIVFEGGARNLMVTEDQARQVVAERYYQLGGPMNFGAKGDKSKFQLRKIEPVGPAPAAVPGK